MTSVSSTHMTENYVQHTWKKTWTMFMKWNR